MIELPTAQKLVLRDCTDPVYYVAIARGSASWPDSPTFHIYAQRELNHGSPTAEKYYEDRMDIKSIGKAILSASDSRMGGLCQAGRMDFTIEDDDDHYSGLNSDGVYYEGRMVQLYLNYDESADDYTDDLLLWTGQVSEVERDVKKRTIKFRCEGLSERARVEIPTRMFDTDSGDYRSMRGQYRPLLFGSLDGAKCFKTADAGNSGGSDHGPGYEAVDTNVGPVGGITDVRYGDSGLIDATGGYARIDTDRSPYTTSGGQILFTDIDDETLAAWVEVPMQDYLLDQTHIPPDAATKCPLMLDEDEATYAEWLWSSSYHANGIMYCFKIPRITTSGTIYEEGIYDGPWITTAVRCTLDVTGSATTWEVFFGWADSVGAGVAVDNATNCETQLSFADYDLDWPLDDSGGQILAYGNGVYTDCDTLAKFSSGCWYLGCNVQLSGSNTATFRVHEIRGCRVLTAFDYPDRDGLYADVDGYTDQYGSFTGTVDALVENPAHIVSYLLYKSGCLVDTDELQNLGGDAALSGIAVARQITDRTTTTGVTDQLAAECGFMVRFRNDGYAGGYTLDDHGGTDFIVTEDMVPGGQLKQAKQTPVKDVVTSYQFRYKMNSMTGHYDETLSCSASTCSDAIDSSMVTLCSDAQQKYTAGRTVKKTFDLEWVRDETVAGLVAERIIRQYANRPWWIELPLDIEMAYVEEGDSFVFSAGMFELWPHDITIKRYVITGVSQEPAAQGLTVKAREMV